MQQILVGDIQFVSAPAEVIVQPRRQIAADRDIRGNQIQGDVVGGHFLEYRVSRVMIEIVAARGIT